MIDKWQAQHEFWSSFGWQAYDDQTTFTEDDLPAYPHITYESVSGGFNARTSISVHLWNRATSWAAIKQKATEIEGALSKGGVVIPFTGGALWLSIPADTVFARPFSTGASDELIQRIMLTVTVDFLSD